MAANDSGDVRGTEMSDTEIESFLYERGHGVLSLARADDAYAVPVSFGYDGDRVFVYLIRFGEGSKKLAVSPETGTACLTAYDVRSRDDWESVVVYGALVEVPEADAAYMDAVMDDNGWFPSFYPPDWEVTGVRRTELRVQTATGRRGVGTA